MGRLAPGRLHVTYLTGTGPDNLTLPRRYTLTHSDVTGQLFLSVGNDYDRQKISGLYTRLMRDEVLAEIVSENNGLVFNFYCHVSGGLVLGTAGWRYNIFRSEMPLVLEAIRYGDRLLFEKYPELDQAPIFIRFQSKNTRFNKVEPWGVMFDYKV